MTEEEASQRRKENTERKEALARKDQRIEELEGLLRSALLRIEERERRLAKESQNSSKPPSSDGFKRKGKKREASSKPKGGQPGHAGHTLEWVETPDQVVIHRPSHCEARQCELGAVSGQAKERRQSHDLPVLRLAVTEHQVEELICPRCQHRMVGTFPHAVQAPAQYGPSVRSLAGYLSQDQLLPMERPGEGFADRPGCSFSGRLSPHFLRTCVAQAAKASVSTRRSKSTRGR
ncbi:MAG TPA: DUF6444 domain-containing protein [Ktedonobacteraceae bacterium]